MLDVSHIFDPLASFLTFLPALGGLAAVVLVAVAILEIKFSIARKAISGGRKAIGRL